MNPQAPDSGNEPDKTEEPLSPVVGIGASAGGLEAVTQLFRNLPATTGMAFVLVQHLDPHHTSALAGLLNAHTSMPVRQATDRTRVLPNHVYVIPPNTRIAIEAGALRLTPRSGDDHARHLPIDYFFRSLAAERKGRAIGVILSGGASDGTMGLEAIKGEGGITFAQDASAKFDSMPRSAIAAGVVDFVLPPEAIARELGVIALSAYLGPVAAEPLVKDGAALEGILSLLRERAGVDFTHYKAPTIHRRLARRLAVHHLDNLEAYLAFLKENPAEINALFDDVLITVTDFFRDPEMFEALSEKVFPQMLKNWNPDEPIRLWVSGCSTGKEVYSIAICLVEYLEKANLTFPIQIFGTDLSERAIETARAGKYPESIAAAVSPKRLNRFFVKLEDEYRIASSIRELCVFSRQDVTSDPPLARMNLISCRNLLIYLDPLLQRRVLSIFKYALRENGFLVLGGSETPGVLADHFQVLDAKHKIYKRNSLLASPAFELPPRLPLIKGPESSRIPITDDATVLDLKADRLLLAEYAPSGFLINAERKVVKFRGEVGSYLGPAAGDPALDLLKLVREDISLHLRPALEQAIRTDAPVRIDGIKIRRNEGFQEINLIVRPIAEPGLERHILVLFEEVSKQPWGSEPSSLQGANEPSQHGDLRNLSSELASTRSYMQGLIEELRSSNEEAQSVNEELQSTNEELQTAKEELQSSNEELITTNEEMHGRNRELSQANNDLLNLLSSMQIPIVMLSKDLRIRRYTPATEKVLSLIPGDVGRPVSDLRSRLKAPDLQDLLADVIRSARAMEREVQDIDGRWYSLRIVPYRTAENRVEGAVFQLFDIDNLKRSLEQIDRARDYAERILSTVREPLLILDQDLRVKRANPSFFETFGVAPAEILDRSLYEVQDRQWDLPKVRQMLDGLLQSSEDRLQDVEVEQDFAGIGWRTFQLNARRVNSDSETNLILLAVEDITDRKRAAEAKYRRLFEAAKDGVLLVDAEDGEITDVNPFLIELTGYSKAEWVGKHFWEAPPLKEIPGIDSTLERLRAEEVVRLPDVPLRTKAGRLIDSEIIGNIYREGEKSVIQFNLRDITERKNFQRQIQETAKLESLGVLAGGIAHDFNNLLTGIMGNASLALTDTPPDTPHHSALKDIVLASHRAADLTRQMLAYAGKGRFVVRRLDLSELAREIGALVRTSVPKSVEVELRLAGDLPPIEVDSSQVQQLIMNLVINGAEAVGEGTRGSVRVTTNKVQLDAEYIRHNFPADELHPGTYVALEVADTGSGMDQATLARIFDPFFTTKFTGRGLGLAAAQGIVRGHHGAIRVSSVLGRGTTFKVLFPAAGQQPQQDTSPVEQKGTDLKGTGLVLIADDEDVVLRLAKAVLERYGYQTITAENGEIAVEVVRNRGHELKLVILDLTMPVMGGEAALAQIKSIRPDLPVVLASGFDAAEAVERFGDDDLAGFIQKPFTLQTLLESVKAAAPG